MATILYVPAVIGNAFNTYELTTAYNGLTNLAAIISKYADITIKGDTVGNKTPCNCAPSLDGYKWNVFTIPMDVWVAIMSDIATNIYNGSGTVPPATQILAQYLAPWFLNISFWNVTGWDAATSGAFYAARNANVSARFVPAGTQGGNSSFRNNVGFYGSTVADGANTVTIGGLSALNGKSVTVTISGIDGSGNYVSAGAATAVISSGIFSASISATITPGANYFVGITSATIFSHSDFGGSVFKVNIGYGKNFTGVNAALQIDQWGLVSG